MQGSPQTINRVYLILDTSRKSCIIDYRWSSTNSVWVMEKTIWNTGSGTRLENSLREGKYNLAVF